MQIFGEIIGPDILIVLLVVALLFGGSQIPKLARSLGQASKEFKRGSQETPEDVKRGTQETPEEEDSTR